MGILALKRQRNKLFAALFFAMVASCLFAVPAFAQEGKYANYQAAALDITYDHVFPIAQGINSNYSGTAAAAPNYYGGDLGHASSATCGMTFLMKPGYKIAPTDDTQPISVSNLSIYDTVHNELVEMQIGDIYYLRATWVIITYTDKSADLVMFGNTMGRSFGPVECTSAYSNDPVACGDEEWAFSCDNVFSDEILVSETSDFQDISSTFPMGSTTNLESIRNWKPAGIYGYTCPTSHFENSFESHYGCTMIYPGQYADTLTDEQKEAAAAAISYEQQTQEEQCGGIVGFFTCPLAESISNFLKTVYDVFSGFFLNIDPEVFNGNRRGTSGYAIHKAWSNFRNIANVMIVVALLIVILSQISGIGINNYGIKKSLPKIIIAALLVNLSYVICQGAIDLSNIFGHRIGDIFENMLASSGSVGVTSYTGSNVATLIFILIGVIVAIIKFGSKIWVALILLLLVAAVAMFIMLAVSVIRQALCILLVVVSPVALCCYMIPGTKSVYKRWFDMFKGVLVAYPMTTLVVYGSSYAATILLKAWGFSNSGINAFKSSNFFTTFFESIAGLLIVVVPYFFIPKIIMKSLGVLNGVVSGIGNAMIKNTSGAVRGSAFAQRQNDQQEFRKNVRRAGLHYNNKTGTIENRRKPGNNRFTRALGRMRDSYFNHPVMQRYARNAYSMAAQRRRGRSYYSGGNELDEILQDRSTDSNELKQRKAELRRRLEHLRRSGRSTEGIRRQVNRMFGKGGEFESFVPQLPQKFRDAAGNFTGAKGDAETTAENIEKGAETQRTREYIKQIESTAGLTEEDMSENIIDAATSGNKELTSAYITVLLGSGEAGRDALLECIKTNGLSGDTLDIIAGSVSVAEMNDIKKKDPYLYKRIKALQNNSGISAGSMNVDNNFKMECCDVRGMSAKQFSEMDASAQQRLIDEITDPSIYGSGTGYNPEDGIVAAAVNLAEEILSDESLRASISPDRLSNLENIVRIRDDAVQKSVQSNRTSDLSAINGVTATNGAGQKLVDSIGTDFTMGILASSLSSDYVEAAKNGDSVRMESIQQNIEAKYRDNLRNAGVNLTEDANAMMLATLQDLYTQLNESVDSDNIKHNDFHGADDAAKRRNADARDGFVDLLSGRMDRRRRNFRR